MGVVCITKTKENLMYFCNFDTVVNNIYQKKNCKHT